MIRLLILGSTGLIGNNLLKYFSHQKNFRCYGAIRRNSDKKKLKNIKNIKLFKINFSDKKNIKDTFDKIKPNLVINCLGVIKHITNKNKFSEIIRSNSLLPHYFAELLSNKKKTRLIHFSTDCVFSGAKGNYKENDLADAHDLYGRSKFLGEVYYSNTLTLRTSVIGHEIESGHNLLNWFLKQNKPVAGFKNAIFSGLTTLQIAKILHRFIIPNKRIAGLYHLSGKKINKYDLLKLIKKVYQKDIKIKTNHDMIIDRSLNSNALQKITGYKPTNWFKNIKEMFEFSYNK
tara:strand:- start:5605 stop:6471 length:867 start_codon:yes stop_codon:yes gene_type:complete